VSEILTLPLSICRNVFGSDDATSILMMYKDGRQAKVVVLAASSRGIRRHFIRPLVNMAITASSDPREYVAFAQLLAELYHYADEVSTTLSIVPPRL
jgi:hypothetical protein